MSGTGEQNQTAPWLLEARLSEKTSIKYGNKFKYIATDCIGCNKEKFLWAVTGKSNLDLC